MIYGYYLRDCVYFYLNDVFFDDSWKVRVTPVSQTEAVLQGYEQQFEVFPEFLLEKSQVFSVEWLEKAVSLTEKCKTCFYYGTRNDIKKTPVGNIESGACELRIDAFPDDCNRLYPECLFYREKFTKNWSHIKNELFDTVADICRKFFSVNDETVYLHPDTPRIRVASDYYVLRPAEWNAIYAEIPKDENVFLTEAFRIGYIYGQNNHFDVIFMKALELTLENYYQVFYKEFPEILISEHGVWGISMDSSGYWIFGEEWFLQAVKSKFMYL